MNSPYNGNFFETQRYTHGKHDGLDLVGITHKDIHAVKPGKVVYAGWENPNDQSQGFGQYVAIKEDNTNRIWYYGHLSEIKVNVCDTVGIGDIIGIEGTTGRSTGNHLHICVRENGTKGCDLDVSTILNIPNVETDINHPYNDGFEPIDNVASETMTDDEFVRFMQTFLNNKFNADLVVDGICGTKTRSAVKKYLGV